MAKITLNDTTLDYTDQGSGEPLILVHGSVGDSRSWNSQANVFSRHFRTVNYSRRYHWPNPEISDGEEYTMIRQLDDLEQLILSLDAAPAHLVGHSYGAYLSLLLAIRDPSLVRSLVLAEPPVITLFVSNTPKPMEILKMMMTNPLTGYSIIKLGARGLERAKEAFEQGNIEEGIEIYSDAVFGPNSMQQKTEFRKRMERDNLTNAIAELFGPGFIPLENEQIRNISTPALIVNGQESISLFHRLNNHLSRLLPDIRRLNIPGGTHVMHEENPEAFNEGVLSFLKTI